MIALLLLQLLLVAIPAAVGVALLLLVVAPPLGGIIHGRPFTIQWWHALLGGVLVALAFWFAVWFGWVSAP